MGKASKKNPIRILQIGMHDKIGGVETYLMNYYRNIDKSKVQFDFINPYDKLCFEEEILNLGGNIYKIPSFKKHPILYYLKLKKIIKKNNYKIVHINMLSAANILPIFAASRCKVKHIIAHSHNGNIPEGVLRKVLNKLNKRILLKKATDFFACSKLAGEWLFGKKNQFTVINNAIDLKKFEFSKKDRNEIRNKYNLKEKYVIGHIGRFSYQKNHDFLIDAFNEYSKIDKNAILMLIGEGELQNKIKEKIIKYNLENQVIFVGTTNEISKYLSAMDLFVLPSYFEGFPVTGVEAQANGLNIAFSNYITNEIDISKKNEFLNLDIHEWVDYFKKGKKSKRFEFKNKEYDVNYNVLKLEERYINFNKTSIAHILYGLSLGGVESILYNYFGKNACFNNIIIVQNDIDDVVKKRFEDNDFKIYKIDEKRKSIFKYIKNMTRILKNEKIDIIHSHMTLGNFLPNFVGWMNRIKIRISHSHFAYIKDNPKNLILKYLGRVFSTNYMACSQDAAKYLFGKKYKKCYILNNPVDFKKFCFSKEKRCEVRKKYNIGNSFVIGNIGRFVEQKNQKFLLEICRDLRKKYPGFDYKLLIVGSGKLNDLLCQRIRDYNIEKNVIIIEPCINVEDLYCAFDVFCFPTLFEGLGIVLVEAQVNGLKCICSKNIPNCVKISDNFVSFEIEDTNEWVDEIYSTWKENKNRNRNSIDVKKYKLSGFDLEEEKNKLNEYYEKIIGE